MRHLIAFLTLSLIYTISHSQRDNEIQIRVGIGAAAYSTQSNINYSFSTPIGTFPFSYSDNDGAVTVHMPLELRYEIIERVNVGLDMKFGSYLYSDSTDNTGKSNVFRVIGIGGEFTILNKPNTRLYVGLGLNTSVLEMEERIVVSGVSSTTTMRWRGPGVKLNLGFMQFFGNSPIGINFNIGWDSHNFNLKDWTYPTGTSWITLNSFDGTLKTSGIDLAFGLVFRIRK